MRRRMAEIYTRRCPNPDGNCKCHQTISYRHRSDYLEAIHKSKVCKSCSRIVVKNNKFLGKSSDEKPILVPTSIFTRNCPNPKANPGCKKLIEYPLLELMEDAERLGLVCRCCRKFGLKGGTMSESARYNIAAGIAKRPLTKENNRTVGGWFRGVYFRSSCELYFLLNNQDIDWTSAESKEFGVPYTTSKNTNRFYKPDFFGDERLIEIKPVGWRRNSGRNKDMDIKIAAAVVFCVERGWAYSLLETPAIKKSSIFALRENGTIELNKVWEAKYQEWLAKRKK
jgi:hypothetical protein